MDADSHRAWRTRPSRNPEIDVDLHVREVVSVLEFEELADVILVGHNYAGMVITGVADRVPDRISMHQQAVDLPPGRGRPPFDAKDFDLTEAEDIAWVDAHLVEMPVKCHEQAVQLSGAWKTVGKLTYILCSDPKIGGFDRFAPIAQNDPAWDYHDLATGHDAMITDPEGLAALLLG